MRPSSGLYGEDSQEKVGELARHFLLATRPTDTDKAVSYAQRAGDAALAALAPDEAVRYFSQALDLANQMRNVDAGIRLDLLIGLGTSQRQAGIAEFRETLLEAARSAQHVGDTERLVTAAWRTTEAGSVRSASSIPTGSRFSMLR